MRKCLKIQVSGKVQQNAYRSLIQKHAQSLGIEGIAQNIEDDNVVIYACGPSTLLDQFIDMLYKGTTGSKVNNVMAEPYVNEKNFRGVFRVIGD